MVIIPNDFLLRKPYFTPVIQEPTLEQQRHWVKQYKAAAIALAEQHRRELRALTDEEALRQSDALLSLPATWRARADWSGLVEQQTLFQKLRPK